MSDQLFQSAGIATPEFSPDTIQILMKSKQEAADNAERALKANKQWTNRVAQWDDLIRRAEAYAERPDQAWQAQGEVGAEDVQPDGEVSGP